jgi:tRNA splicing endonuclease
MLRQSGHRREIDVVLVWRLGRWGRVSRAVKKRTVMAAMAVNEDQPFGRGLSL